MFQGKLSHPAADYYDCHYSHHVLLHPWRYYYSVEVPMAMGLREILQCLVLLVAKILKATCWL